MDEIDWVGVKDWIGGVRAMVLGIHGVYGYDQTRLACGLGRSFLGVRYSVVCLSSYLLGAS